MDSRRGVRLVAAFEAAKGVLIVLAGFGLLTLVHRDVQHMAEIIVRHFRLNPASHYPMIFIQLAGNLSDSKLWMMAVFALVYASIRLLEAYGLWGGRQWAEWLAVLSGGLYVPIEVYELFHGMSWIKAGLLGINIGIVIYMTVVLRQSLRKRNDADRSGAVIV